MFAVQSKTATVAGEELMLDGVGGRMVAYRHDRPGWTASIPWVSLENGWRQVEDPLSREPLEAVLSGRLDGGNEASVQLQILGPPSLDAEGGQVRWPVKVLSVDAGQSTAVDDEVVLSSLARGRLEPTQGSWDILIEAAAADVRSANSP